MTMASRNRYSLVWFMLTTVVPSQAFAQVADLGPLLGSPIPIDNDRGRNISVSQRRRPEYEPLGVNLGGFSLFPSLRTGVGYSSNVFAASDSPRGDWFFAIDPEVRLASNWATNSLVIRGGGALRRFATTPLRDENGYYARVNGLIDVDRDSQIIATADVRRAYEGQFSSSAPGNALPQVSFVQSSGLVRASRTFGKLKATFVTDINRLNYSDLRLLSGAKIDQDFRDSTVLRGGGRLAYNLSPATGVFMDVYYSGIAFDLETVRRKPNRDGSQIDLLGGASFDISSKIRGHAGLGYVSRTFNARGVYQPVSGLAFDARAEYFPSGLTTVSAGAKRSIEEAIVDGASGYFSDTYRLRVDHELLRNLTVYGQGEYQRNRFVGVQRLDQIGAIRIGATYIVSRTIVFSAGASYLNRESEGQAALGDFGEWRGILAITGRL